MRQHVEGVFVEEDGLDFVGYGVLDGCNGFECVVRVDRDYDAV